MKETIFALLMSVVCLTLWMWQVDDNNTGFANERLKNSINYAAHDASLQINKAELAKGRIIFDTALAEAAFRQTLRDNLALANDLTPKPDTLFKKQVAVLYADYIDDEDGVAFPYFYENDTYGIHHTINGPAVVFAVKAPRPQVFNVNPAYDLVKWAVFEYPMPFKE